MPDASRAARPPFTAEEHEPFVPTLVDAHGSRHIIPHKDAPPLCDPAIAGTQVEPAPYRRDQLCQRCLQRHIKAILEETNG